MLLFGFFGTCCLTCTLYSTDSTVKIYVCILLCVRFLLFTYAQAQSTAAYYCFYCILTNICSVALKQMNVCMTCRKSTDLHSRIC